MARSTMMPTSWLPLPAKLENTMLLLIVVPWTSAGIPKLKSYDVPDGQGRAFLFGGAAFWEDLEPEVKEEVENLLTVESHVFSVYITARRDTSAADALVRRFADRFWGTDWPGQSRPQVYYGLEGGDW